MNGDFSLADSVIQVYHEWEIKEALALFIYKPVEWNLLHTLFVLNKKVGKSWKSFWLIANTLKKSG